MRRKLTRAVAATTTIALALGLSACGSSDDSKRDELTLRLAKRDTDDFEYVDRAPKTKVGPQGPEMLSIGDQIISRGEYLDGASKRVGDLDLACTVTKSGTFASASQQCLATATLPGGSLAFSVGGPFRAGTGMSVVGGTGKYEGASGSFTSKPARNGQSKDVVHVFVPKK